jgi:predicted hydrolase (HD superfamily)
VRLHRRGRAGAAEQAARRGRGVVKREDITGGAEELGLSLDEHIATVLGALKGVAPELGLG